MPAIVSNQQNRWQDHIPYVIGPGIARVWLLGKILEFNTRVGRNVFVGRTDEQNYACFVPGANSPIGMQGNMQNLMCNRGNLFHEMGHCVGLGHTYFHGRSRLPGLFEGVDRAAFLQSAGIYSEQGFADVDSMMAYSPPSFNASPRIQRVCVLCQNNRLSLPAARQNLQPLIGLRRRPAAARPAAQFQVALQIPAVFRNRRMHFKIAGHWAGTQVNDYNILRTLDPNDLAQFEADLVIIRDYWKFNDGFMMRVSDDDVKAIRAVVRE